ncbi:hypothetical protein F442_02199 [Phytophthora nicotianae P10297]|uniref:Uncharacterized protein n=2 Tax=Phytophthora nicotianae TaxID=4792 RepID=W3A0Y2_PHYNI|nr:hypothetical protein F444_02247 [Phytophthora nicotianae P1976]ETP52861.1 hypothetical protein F442_02199 [Phytophthora nicotianae P10297]
MLATYGHDSQSRGFNERGTFGAESNARTGGGRAPRFLHHAPMTVSC